MADLIDRIAVDGVDGRPRINLHRFISAQRLYSLSVFTRSQIATEFDLIGQEAMQASSLADKIDQQVGISNKVLYILRAESVMICIADGEDGLYHNLDGTVNKTKVYTDLLFL